jgi:glyceraldehyde-3-phosphate dehydrogenase (NADP+)
METIPEKYRPVPVHQDYTLVNGEFRAAEGGMKRIFSPIHVRGADGKLVPAELGSVPAGSDVDIKAALDAAVAAYNNGRGPWPTMGVAKRIACVEHFIRLMLPKREEVVRLLMWEIGKSHADSAKEFDRTVEYIRATVSALKELDHTSSRFVIAEDTIGIIRRTPLGVVLCLGPYNYPLNETFTTLIPALIMGNCVITKPPRHGCLLFASLLPAFREAFPKGVVNTVYGSGSSVVPAMIQSGSIDVLTLIGSSKVAGELKKLHPKANRLRAVLGLDAKNAAIVLADADIELAVKECIAGSLSYNGQRCTAIKMIMVHRNIVDKFLERFLTEMEKLKIGMPWEEGVKITPMPTLDKIKYLTTCLEDAVAQGAKILNKGGGAVCQTLFNPALVYPVKDGMKLYREEQFGPVVPVMPFDRVEQAMDYIITSDYGQQISIFGSDPDQIARLVDPLVNQVCRVNINCQCQRGPDVFPFAGRKDSAEGTLSVSDALRSFSIRSMVAAKQTKASEELLDDIAVNQKSSFISTRYLF